MPPGYRTRVTDEETGQDAKWNPSTEQFEPDTAGSGDMVKATYDPDDDGKVAEAELVLSYPTHDNSLDHTQGTDQGLDSGGANAVTAEQTKATYTHSQASHAPSNAQKNSDILKTEIEAVLTGELTSHTHSGGGGDYSPLRYRLAGRYHSAFPDSNSTLVLTINRLYAIPFMVVDAKTITRIAIHVTSIGSAASARLGIYQDNGSIYPGTLVSDCGIVSMAATGIKEITGLNISLTANTLYWLVLVCNVAATVSALAVVYLNSLLGYPTTALNTVGSSNSYVAFTYGALPASYPGSAIMSLTVFPKIAVYW